MTTDIFEQKILCKCCNTEMNPVTITKNGFVLRTVECQKCRNRIIHPKDEKEYGDFINLRKKEFSVKIRFVGNSYAVSIPKEIVNFIREHEKIMNDMVKLCYEEFGRLSIDFGCNGNNHNGDHIHGNKINGKLKVER